MIRLGYTAAQKNVEVLRYCRRHDIQKVFVLSPQKFRFPCAFAQTEMIEWSEIIQYKFFYRLLQEINNQTLVVVNECLRTQHRYDLTYNCIRNFLNQTSHQMIFQHLPCIDTREDFMILFDFDTRSRWKREKFQSQLLTECDIDGTPIPLVFLPITIKTNATIQAAYTKEKERLFATIGLKDPHTIPRNLYLLSGKAKAAHIKEGHWHIGRNTRLRIPLLCTYKEPSYPHQYTVFEFCHNFIDFADVVALSGQSRFDVLTTDLKVDDWYLERYHQWAGRIADAYAAILGENRLSSVA